MTANPFIESAVDRFLGTPEPVADLTVTCAGFPTERESCSYFDNLIDTIGLFKVQTEVHGYPLQPRLGQDLKTLRIDRILVPKPDLLERGWQLGPIGIEIKRSGEKIGTSIAQMQDYSRAAWDMRNGVWIVPQWFFLWPMAYQYGPIASVLAQNRLGSATPGSRRTRLILSAGRLPALAEFYTDGNIRLGPATNGRKAGSR